MAPLTWRNVDRGGNFGDSVAALRLSGDLLNRGFQMGDQALSDFDTWRTEQNDRMALASAQRIQDPAVYRAALENGTALGGINPTQLSARTLGLLDARSGALTERDAAQYANNRTQTVNAAEDAAAPAVAALTAAIQRGDAAAIATAERNLSLAGVPLSRVMEIRRGIAGIEGTVANTQQTRQQTARGAYELAVATATEADRRAAQAAIQEISTNSWDDARANEALRARNLSPGAWALAVQGLSPRYPSLLPNANTGAGAPTPAGQAGQRVAAAAPTGADSVHGNGRFGQIPGGASNNTMGAVFDFGRNTLIPNSRGQVGAGPNQGTSAQGAFQIIGSTMATHAQRIFGDNWRNIPFSFENQRRIAESIYNENRGGDLTQQWTGLRGTRVPGSNVDAGERGAWANVPWSVAEPLIMAREANGAVTRAAGDARSGQEAEARIAERRAENNQQFPMNRRYQALADSELSVADVARGLREGTPATTGANARPGTQPTYPGIDQIELETQIDNLRRANPGMSAAQAGLILQNAATTQGDGWYNPWTRRRAIDSTRVAAEAARYTRGDASESARLDREMETQSAAITAARENVTQISQEISRLERGMQTNPAFGASLPPLLDRLEAARARLNTLYMQQESLSDMNPRAYNERRAANRPGANGAAAAGIQRAVGSAGANERVAPTDPGTRPTPRATNMGGVVRTLIEDAVVGGAPRSPTQPGDLRARPMISLPNGARRITGFDEADDTAGFTVRAPAPPPTRNISERLASPGYVDAIRSSVRLLQENGLSAVEAVRQFAAEQGIPVSQVAQLVGVRL